MSGDGQGYLLSKELLANPNFWSGLLLTTNLSLHTAHLPTLIFLSTAPEGTFFHDRSGDLLSSLWEPLSFL